MSQDSLDLAWQVAVNQYARVIRFGDGAGSEKAREAWTRANERLDQVVAEARRADLEREQAAAA